jgi:DNA-directed RNA polymerase specialized sigma24 family protein
MKAMDAVRIENAVDSHGGLEAAYRSEKPRFMARLRAAGRTLEEAEDLLHDVYAETRDRLHLVAGIVNLPAWINALLTRRMIDAWRHEKARATSGITDVTEETQREIISEVGLDPRSAGWLRRRCSAG